jgi:hypothetical protein
MPENTSLMQFNELPAIAADAPTVLAKNTDWMNKGIAKGQGLLDTIEAEGMSPDLDEACNEYLAQVAGARTKMNERRSPITKMLTAISKEFTRLENALDKADSSTIPYKIQAARNELARTIALEQQRKQQELRNKQLADQERIDLKIKVQLRVREKYNEILFNFKKEYNEVFNTMNLENIEVVKAELTKIPVHYPELKFKEITCAVTSVYLKPDQLEMLVYNARAELYMECAADFKKNMEELQHYLLDQVPARKTELEEIESAKKADKKKADQLQKDAELRQQEETLRLAKENQQKEQMAVASANTATLVGNAQLEFDKEVGTAEILSGQTQSVKHSYVIKVMSRQGWMQIVNMWFTHCAMNVPHDKFGAKKLESMKADLEKLAFAGGARLEDSGHLVYERDVKALTKKV